MLFSFHVHLIGFTVSAAMRILYYDLIYEFHGSDDNYENFTANIRMNDTRNKAKHFSLLIRTLDLEC